MEIYLHKSMLANVTFVCFLSNPFSISKTKIKLDMKTISTYIFLHREFIYYHNETVPCDKIFYNIYDYHTLIRITGIMLCSGFAY